jgi:hypothetical protein
LSQHYIGEKYDIRLAYFPAANANAPGQTFDLTKATAISGWMLDDCLTVHGITESMVASSDRGVNGGGVISFSTVLISTSSSSSSSSSTSSYANESVASDELEDVARE